DCGDAEVRGLRAGRLCRRAAGRARRPDPPRGSRPPDLRRPGCQGRGGEGRGHPRRDATRQRRGEHEHPRLRPAPVPHGTGAHRGGGPRPAPHPRAGRVPLQPRPGRRGRDDARLRRRAPQDGGRHEGDRGARRRARLRRRVVPPRLPVPPHPRRPQGLGRRHLCAAPRPVGQGGGRPDGAVGTEAPGPDGREQGDRPEPPPVSEPGVVVGPGLATGHAPLRRRLRPAGGPVHRRRPHPGARRPHRHRRRRGGGRHRLVRHELRGEAGRRARRAGRRRGALRDPRGGDRRGRPRRRPRREGEGPRGVGPAHPRTARRGARRPRPVAPAAPPGPRHAGGEEDPHDGHGAVVARRQRHLRPRRPLHRGGHGRGHGRARARADGAAHRPPATARRRRVRSGQLM
ncbi:MAG: Predicted functional analog of homoserine kinase, partial [uncultured Acidimicrobiales bacterium]